MIVTVFSDAGVCPEIGRASWGAWIKSQRGTARGGGVFRAPCRVTNIAEARAVINAVYLGLRERVIWPGDALIVQTDNDTVPALLAGTVSAKTNPEDKAQIRAEIVKLLTRHRLTLEWRHVKAHKGTATNRNAVNTYCDSVATFFLRLERESVAPGKFKQAGGAPYGITDPRPNPPPPAKPTVRARSRPKKAVQPVATGCG